MIKHFESYLRVTSPYGKRKSPITGKEEFHSGVDVVKANIGDILVTVPGTVVFAKFADKGTGVGGFGNVVCVVDENNHLHLYGHLDSVSCKVNQTVKKGDVIGKQGNTGQSAGSHLHYEIRTKASPSFGWGFHTDPIAYLDKYENEEKAKDWKQQGLEYLQKEAGISASWKPTDAVDIGTLGTILKRLKL